MPARVETDDAVACAERPHLRAPIARAAAEAVHEEDDGTVAGSLDVQARWGVHRAATWAWR
jgi:hypothetical protein